MKAASLHIALLLPTVLLLSSCSGETKETPLTSMFYGETPAMFSRSVPVNGRGGAQLASDVKFTFVYDNDQATVDITAINLDLGNGPADYIFKGVDWAFSVGTPAVERVVRKDFIVSIDAMGGQQALDDVTMIYYEPNELDATDSRGVYIDFTADGRRYTLYPEHLYCRGTTVVKPSEGGHSILYNPAISIDFRPSEGRADLVIANFSIGGESIPFHLPLSDVTATFTPGGYALKAANKAVTDSLTIENFSATADMLNQLTAEYDVVTPTERYSVNMELIPNYYDTPTVQSAI